MKHYAVIGRHSENAEGACDASHVLYSCDSLAKAFTWKEANKNMTMDTDIIRFVKAEVVEVSDGTED